MTRLGFFITLSALATAHLPLVSAQGPLWARQDGTGVNEVGIGVAVDAAGNSFVAGFTDGSLRGSNQGTTDVFIAKYDPAGNPLWTRQIGTKGNDIATGLGVDGLGNLYITGRTTGNLGGTNAGSTDIFLMKYDPAGFAIWTRQVGTTGDDEGDGLFVDAAGNAYITGYTGGTLGPSSAGLDDAFLLKYDASGKLLWVSQFGTSDYDYGSGIAVDGSGNAYVAGRTAGSLAAANAGQFDAFLAKFDPTGKPLWTRQSGTTGLDFGTGVAVDGAGNAYMSGHTRGSLFAPNLGGYDAFLVKYSASGALRWARQFGTPGTDHCYSVAVDGAGNSCITGGTAGNLASANLGGADVFLARYDPAGSRVWITQFGTPGNDYGNAVALDGAGNAFIGGSTLGDLGAANAGLNDYFIAKFAPPGCRADFNHDGFLNADDFDDFAAAFLNGDATADFDGNGFVNGEDADTFAAAFDIGC